MGRIKNATFKGSPTRDVVKDASIFEKWMLNVAGDLAKLADLVTGENTETPIDHTGNGLGALLKMPLAAQHIAADITLLAGTTEEDYYILAVPVFVPEGEGQAYRLTMSVDAFAAEDIFVEVRDAAWALDFGPVAGSRTVVDVGRPRTVSDEEGVRPPRRERAVHEWYVTLGNGLQYLLVKRMSRTADTDAQARLLWWTLDHDRSYAGESNGLVLTGSDDAGSRYRVNAASYQPSNQHNTYDEEVNIEGPLSAYVLTRINREINALWERITGAKIPGNREYQTTTTWDHDRAKFASEGLIDFPLTIIALGSAVADGNKAPISPVSASPTSGMTGWARLPTTQTGTLTVATIQIHLPDFGPSTSTLKADVLFFLPSAPGGTWQARVSPTSGASAWVSLTQIGTSPYYHATITAIPYVAGSELLSIQMQHLSGGALSDVVAVLGAAFYFEKP